MANQEQVKMLRRDIDAWNRWKAEHPSTPVDLAAADLNRADLLVANLSGADLAPISCWPT
jgi:hypothetical protein